jgi:hypothetical protein
MRSLRELAPHALCGEVAWPQRKAGNGEQVEVSVPRTLSVAEVKKRLVVAARLSMWASTTRPPQVELARHTPEKLTFGLTVYALHPDYDLEVENAVRAAVEEMWRGGRADNWTGDVPARCTAVTG